jgi:tetratricopeptide (TPR) repeat protein
MKKDFASRFLAAFRLSRSCSVLLSVGLSLNCFSPAALALTPGAHTYYLQAVQAERRGQLDIAEQALRKAIAIDPSDYLNLVKLGAVLNQEGRPNEAISYLQQAATLTPSDDMILYSLGGLYEQLGQPAKAEQAYLQALRKNAATQTAPGIAFAQPMYYFALLNLSRTEIQLKKYPAAINHYQSFLTHYPQHFEARRRLANLYLVTGQNQLAVQQYELLKQRFPGAFEDNVSLARALNGSNEPQKALQELQVAYAREGSKADIMEEMGRANAALGQNDLAISNYRRAYTLNPQKETLLLKMADLYRSQKQWNGAIEEYQLYLKQHPSDLGTHRQLADAYLENQQYDLALTELNELLNRTDNPDLRYGLQKDIAYSTHMLGDLPKAIGLYEGLMLMPEAQNDLQLRMNLALAYHKSNQYEQAAEYYKQVYAASPERLQEYQVNRDQVGNDLAAVLTSMGDNDYKKKDWVAAVSHYGEATVYGNKNDFWPYLGLGNSYYALKQNDKAYEAYGEVLARDPKNVTARLYRSQIELASKGSGSDLNASGNATGQSLVSLENLAKEQPENSEVLITLGDAYAQKGDDIAAITSYEQALKIGTANPKDIPPGTDSATVLGGGMDSTARYNLLMAIGGLWQKQGRFTDAASAYERAQAINSGFADLHYNLGIVNNELGNLKRSEAEYRQALSLDPNATDARYGLAITLDKQGRKEEALEAYEFYAQTPNARYATDARERIQLLRQVNKPQPAAPVSPKLKSPTLNASPASSKPISAKNNALIAKPPSQVSTQSNTLQSNSPRRIDMARTLPAQSASEQSSSNKAPHSVPSVPRIELAPVQAKPPANTAKLPSKPVAPSSGRIDMLRPMKKTLQPMTSPIKSIMETPTSPKRIQLQTPPPKKSE